MGVKQKIHSMKVEIAIFALALLTLPFIILVLVVYCRIVISISWLLSNAIMSYFGI